MEQARYDRRRQGDYGEISALAWLGQNGYAVFVPVGHSPDYDLVADNGSGVLRVQVKTATHFRNGRWEVMTATRGGNQSWSGTAKLFSADRCDYLFALVGDGRRWFIPSRLVGGHRILLGGPKFAQYEVEPGHPTPMRSAA